MIKNIKLMTKDNKLSGVSIVVKIPYFIYKQSKQIVLVTSKMMEAVLALPTSLFGNQKATMCS